MMESYSYIACALVYILILLGSLSVWRGRFLGVWLIQALAFTAIWAGYLGLSTWLQIYNPTNETFLEIVRNASWVLFIWKLHTFNLGLSNADFWRLRPLWLFICAVAALLLFNLLQPSVLLLQTELPSARYLAPFVLVLVLLFMLEQWYRNIVHENRWTVKFMAIGLAVMFGYDLILYSESLLYNSSQSVLWETRGWVDALVAPFVALSINRHKNAEQPVRMSHKAAFFTTSILLVGLYLLCMALVGYYVRWFGSGWGNALQIIFVALCLSFLAILIGSGRVRGLVSVWISKHFFTYKYDYREQWMRANARLASLPWEEGFYHQLIFTLSEPFDSPGGVLWTRGDQGLLFRASWGGPELPMLKDEGQDSLIRFCAESRWVVELDEFRESPSNYPELSMPGWLLNNTHIWVLVPLLHQDELYGILALNHPRARRTINWEDHDLFKALGAQIASLIALRHANEALTEARQFEAYNRLSAFVVHDLKNIIAQLSMVVVNAERHKRNPEFIDDALVTLDNAVNRMNRLLSQLRQESQLNIATEVVDVADILRSVQAHQKQQLPALQLESLPKGVRVQVESERFVSVLCHLVQNAQEATDVQGSVIAELNVADGFAEITITDTGSGMDQDFIRNRLFKPFDTTKGRAGMGIGVYEAQQFIRGLGGYIEVSSVVGEGSRFIVRVPQYLPDAAKQDASIENQQCRESTVTESQL